MRYGQLVILIGSINPIHEEAQKHTTGWHNETAGLDPDFNANVNAYCPLSSAQLQFCSSRHWRSPQGGGCVKDDSLSSAVGVLPTQPHWDPGIAKYGGLEECDRK